MIGGMSEYGGDVKKKFKIFRNLSENFTEISGKYIMIRKRENDIA